MSPELPQRSLEERVTRLEARADSRSMAVAALVLGALVMYLLFDLGVLQAGSGAPVG